MSDPGRTTPTRVDRAQNADQGWRKRIDGIAGLLDELADVLAASSLAVRIREHTADTLVRRAAHLIRSARSDTTTEERAAWDAYAAACEGASERHAETAAAYADCLLVERRKRFPGRDT
jgi:hypothetical protein